MIVERIERERVDRNESEFHTPPSELIELRRADLQSLERARRSCRRKRANSSLRLCGSRGGWPRSRSAGAPVHDLPGAATLLENCGADAIRIDVPLRNVCRHRVLERYPRTRANHMRHDVTELIAHIGHVFDFGLQMMIAVIGPSVISMAVLKDGDAVIVRPQALDRRHVLLLNGSSLGLQSVADSV